MSAFLAATAVGVFVGYLTAFRVLMVWVFDRTGSLFVAMLMHASLTASLLILNPVGISGARLLAYSFALALALWVVVAGVVVTAARRLSQQHSLGSREVSAIMRGAPAPPLAGPPLPLQRLQQVLGADQVVVEDPPRHVEQIANQGIAHGVADGHPRLRA